VWCQRRGGVTRLVLHEFFGDKNLIGRLMGVAMVFCMTATMIGTSLRVERTRRGYALAWQSPTAHS
jgi:hypothetical protein